MNTRSKINQAIVLVSLMVLMALVYFFYSVSNKEDLLIRPVDENGPDGISMLKTQDKNYTSDRVSNEAIKAYSNYKDRQENIYRSMDRFKERAIQR